MPTPKAIDSGSPRDVPLEALRGIAALVVVAWHFSMAFLPDTVDAAFCNPCNTPLFAFMHGTAAVGVFFALSGYVLTRRFFETGEKRILIIGSLKRWFRLFLPVFLSVMISWILFHFHLYRYEEAAKISHSGWLISFGFAMRPPFDPTFWMALREGLTEAFFHNNNALNPILWTIHLELIGSFIVFAFAALIIHLRARPWLILTMAVIVMIPMHYLDATMAPFIPGCILALYSPRHKSIKLAAAIALILLGIAFIGYRKATGFYFMFDFHGPMDSDVVIYYTSAIGSILIMIALIGCAPIRNVLSGRVAQILGRLSFPIYLVHMILICSLGSAVYAAVFKESNYNQAAIAALAALIPAILISAWIFMVVDVKWVAFVNSKFRKVKI